MDPFDLINELRQNQSINHDLSTPLEYPTSPFSPASNATEQDLISRTRRADKERRFQRYMIMNNVSEVAVESGQREDADEFYNDVQPENKNDVVYLKSQNRSVSDVEIDGSVLRAYNKFDVHKEQQLREVPTESVDGSKYDDGLSLKEVNYFEIDYFDSMRFKNNLVECFKEYLFIGSNSKILVMKHEKLISSIDVRPTFTTRRDRASATWSYFPHTINFMKVCKLRDKDVLACAVDDGRALFYDIYDVFIERKETVPKYELKLSSSVWGIDTYKDMAVVSDNSQTITVFLFENNEIYHYTSNQIIHNIPDVAFVHTNQSEDENVVFVSCVSISGEFILFQFDKITNYGPVNKPSNQYQVSIDTVDVYLPFFCKYEFECEIISRTVLQEDAWGTHYIDDKYFKEVNTPDYLGSKTNIDVEKVLKNSRSLNLVSNHLLTSDLGGGAWYEMIEINTPLDRSPSTENKLNRFTDKFSRIKKSYLSTDDDESVSPIPKSQHHEKFLFVATASKVGIYRFNKLVCNSVSGKLFDYPLPEELTFSNRLSITKLIPEISTMIVVSQAGFVAIFRLVQHRGLHSMRFEHMIPKSDPSSFETIVGVGVRRVEETTFWLYITFSDGGIFVYELKNHDEIDTLNDSIVN